VCYGARTGRIPIFTGGPPDDGQLVDLVTQMAPTPAERQKLLVNNPQRLYRFAKL